ncbi:unnamed protein product [Boreogadus saida]
MKMWQLNETGKAANFNDTLKCPRSRCIYLIHIYIYTHTPGLFKKELTVQATIRMGDSVSLADAISDRGGDVWRRRKRDCQRACLVQLNLKKPQPGERVFVGHDSCFVYIYIYIYIYIFFFFFHVYSMCHHTTIEEGVIAILHCIYSIHALTFFP